METIRDKQAGADPATQPRDIAAVSAYPVGATLNGPSKLLRLPELARELGVSQFFVRTMKRAGFPMPGNVALREWALDWLRANPSFLPSAYQRAGDCRGAQRPALTVSDTRHSPPLTRGRHTPLPGTLKRRSARDVLRQ